MHLKRRAAITLFPKFELMQGIEPQSAAWNANFEKLLSVTLSEYLVLKRRATTTPHQLISIKCAQGGTRTHTGFPPPDFESGPATYYGTWAYFLFAFLPAKLSVWAWQLGQRI